MQTPEAWLSTGSALNCDANLPRTAPSVTEPSLVVSAGRDLDVSPRTHTRAILAALGSTDKTHLDFPGSAHYFEPAPDEPEGASIVALVARLSAWLAERCPV
jgi:alpha-beta hydrolase superfamily lysophospholipase